MATLSAVPQTVDLEGYAGDTLTLAITAPDELILGRIWTAQIRASHEATTVDAEFDITPSAGPGQPTYLTLPGSETARLAGFGTLQRVSVKNRIGTYASVMAMVYTAVWDCEVTDPLGEPNTTLVRGTIKIELDVTRLP